jgi:ATP-binding cassette, subfamily A (ABC1), member 3
MESVVVIPLRTLADGLEAASGGRNTLAFVNNGLAGGDINRVIDSVAQAASPAGKKIARLTDEAQLLDTCKSSLRGATSCCGAIVFVSSLTEGVRGSWNYTLRADGAFGEKIDMTKDNNDAEIYLLLLQRAVDYAIAGVNNLF